MTAKQFFKNDVRGGKEMKCLKKKEYESKTV